MAAPISSFLPPSLPLPATPLEIKTGHLDGKEKIKCALVQGLRLWTGRTAHRGSRGILYPFLTTALEGGEGSASLPGRFLAPGKTRDPLYRRLGGPQGRSGQVRKISLPTWIRSPDLPVRSQSLYRLGYPPLHLDGMTGKRLRFVVYWLNL